MSAYQHQQTVELVHEPVWLLLAEPGIMEGARASALGGPDFLVKFATATQEILELPPLRAN